MFLLVMVIMPLFQSLKVTNIPFHPTIEILSFKRAIGLTELLSAVKFRHLSWKKQQGFLLNMKTNIFL